MQPLDTAQRALAAPGLRAVAPLAAARYGRIAVTRLAAQKGCCNVKRLVTVLGALGLISMGLSPSSAGAQPKIETSPVTFRMSSRTCPHLPPRTTLRGRGTMRSVTTTTVLAGGVTRVINSSHARGTATDQASKRYVFDYSNTFSVRNIPPMSPGIYTGLMYDLFTLSGPGPAELVNGFVAQFTTDLGQFARLEPIDSFGDPLNFSKATARCDPL
jgi:hypothetical protein